jgi:hypothetical protein
MLLADESICSSIDTMASCRASRACPTRIKRPSISSTWNRVAGCTNSRSSIPSPDANEVPRQSVSPAS